MTSVEEARDSILCSLKPLAHPEILPIVQGTGRVMAEDVFALCDVPAFDNSSVDGYAVMAGDLTNATRIAPVTLRVVGTISAGEAPTIVLTPGTCARIFTGAVLPPGADAVVMQEDVVSDEQGTAIFQEPIKTWEGVRLVGEDVRRNSLLVSAGEKLRAGHIGLLAAAGHAEVAVHRRPRVCLLVTGSELTRPGGELGPGQIYDSNRALLSALAIAEGAQVVSDSHVSDNLELTMAALHSAVRSADVVVTTGGVSVGAADLVKTALMALGGSIEKWRVAMRPGKPFAWGHLEGAYWFGLPGNPVSAYVTWWAFVGPALRKLMGMRDPLGRRITARLAEPVANPGDRRHFVRVTLNSDGVRLAGVQASHIQSSLAAANALLDVPPHTSWAAGCDVQVELLD